MFIFPQFHTSSLLSCPITRLLEYRSDHLQNLACFLNQQSSHRAICILGINKYLSKNVKTEKNLRKPLFQIFNSIFSKFSTPYVFFQKIGEHLSLLLKLSPFSHFMKKKKKADLVPSAILLWCNAPKSKHLWHQTKGLSQNAQFT